MNINLVTHNPPSTARVESGAEIKKPREHVGTPDTRETTAATASERPIGKTKKAADSAAREDVGTPVARDSKANAASERPIGEAKAPVETILRVELKIHEGTGRVVGRVVDVSTHRVVRELPPEDLLRYLEKTRELFEELMNHDLGQAIDQRV